MSKFRKIDISKVSTIKFDRRNTKSDLAGFASSFDPDGPFSRFMKSLPHHLKARDLTEFARKIAESSHDGKKIIWMMGAHPLKVGLSPVIIDMIKRGFVSHLAVTGAFLIHDLEIAFFGRTSEEVSDTIGDGSFGMIEETPRLIFDAAARADEESLGLGEGAGKFIIDEMAKNETYSVLGSAYKQDVPVTVHMALGTDTISQHPGFDGGLMGKLSNHDFLVFCDSVAGMTGGVIMNFGSAVILPEVFLKALAVARNIEGAVEDFAAANFDMIQHYRPNTNVVSRPLAGSGRGYSFTGHHELMIPLLAAAVKLYYGESSGG